MEIIFEINHRFMQEVRKMWPGDGEKQAKLSIIQEGRPYGSHGKPMCDWFLQSKRCSCTSVLNWLRKTCSLSSTKSSRVN